MASYGFLNWQRSLKRSSYVNVVPLSYMCCITLGSHTAVLVGQRSSYYGMKKLIASGSFFFPSLNLLSVYIHLPLSVPLFPSPPWIGTSPGSFGNSLPAAPPGSQTQNPDSRKQKQSQNAPCPNTGSHPTPDKNTRLTFKWDKNGLWSHFSSAYLLFCKRLWSAETTWLKMVYVRR